jgi:osmoprotectant transport system substrate-binding protein
MTGRVRTTVSWLAALAATSALTACGTGTASTTTTASTTSSPASSTTTSSAAATTTTSSTTVSAVTTARLPGTGKPPVIIGDKNYTEQFLLGELYRQALQAQGFSVQVNRNIGPTDVTLQALKSGSLAMYPEYLNLFDTDIAHVSHSPRSRAAAYDAAQRWALDHGLELLSPTPFSDTQTIGTTVAYGQSNRLTTLRDLARVAPSLTVGGPPQFQQGSPGLASIERRYNFSAAAYKPLAVGAQYGALNNGSVNAADVETTDGQLATGNYRALRDPQHLFGWGNVVPVVTASVLSAEGRAFADTINRVSGMLTIPVMRQLNLAVDVSGQDPATVAKQFLETHGVIPPSP